MSDLTGKKIANTYKDLLQINSSASNDGLDGALRRVQDGSGKNSAISLSQSEAKVHGDLTVTGNVSAATINMQGLTVSALNAVDVSATRINATSITTDKLDATTLVFQDVSVSSLRTGDLTAGTGTFTGAVSATSFYGDGSNLTGLVIPTTAVDANTSAITSINTVLSAAQTSITANASAIAINASNIVVNTSAITSINNVVSALNSVVAEVNTSAIAANAQAIALANTSIAANASTVAINLAAITSVNTIAVNNVSAIAAVSALTSVNTAAITSINNVVSALNSVVADVNASAITANASAIAVNASVIAAVSALTSVNAAAITSVNTRINAVSVLTSVNAVNIAAVSALTSVNAAAITSINNVVSALNSVVADVNASAIAANTSAIAVNTSVIAAVSALTSINVAAIASVNTIATDAMPKSGGAFTGQVITNGNVSAKFYGPVDFNNYGILVSSNASAVFKGPARFQGSGGQSAIQLGNSSTQYIDGVARWGTGLIPTSTATYNFGNDSLRWNRAYITEFIGGINAALTSVSDILAGDNSSSPVNSSWVQDRLATKASVGTSATLETRIAAVSATMATSIANIGTSFASATTSANLETRINAVSVLAETKASATTSATLETRIADVSSTFAATSATLATSINNSNTARATLSATMATSINNRTAAITSVNTRINAVSVLTGTNLSAITSINNVVSALNSVVAEVNASAIAANAQAIAVANTSIAANASTVAINLAAITSVNNLAVANTSSIAALSATMATSIGNSNTAIATLSATMATSIGNSNTAIATLSATMATSISNHLPLAGGTVTGDVSFQGSSITLGNSMNDRIYGSALFARDIIPSSATDRYLGDTSRPWNFAYLGAVVADNITVSGNVTAASFYGDGSNLTGITAGASVGTSATLQTKIAAVSSTMATSISNSNTAIATLSATMATSINNRTAAITSVNTRINAVSVLAASVSSTMATSIGNSNTAIATLSATMATSINNRTAAITSVNTRINAVSVLAASVSSTMATSIGNSNTAIATLSATMATSIGNQMPKAGGTFTGQVTFDNIGFTVSSTASAVFNGPIKMNSTIQLGNSSTDTISGSGRWGTSLIPNSTTGRNLGNDSLRWDEAYINTFRGGIDSFLTSVGDILAGDNSSKPVNSSWVQDRLATKASVGTSATLETRIAAVSSTMATSIANIGTSFASATTSANLETRINAVSVLAASVSSTMATSINNSNTAIATLSATMATSINNSNTAIATLSATMATSIGNKVSKAGDTITGNLSFGDNNKAIFGAGSDLQIYHDGSNSYIDESGSGSLIVEAVNLYFRKTDGENYIRAIADQEVTLYYDNAEKLATTAGGISITGIVSASGDIVSGGNISGVTKSFDIEHPTKDGMRLHHGVLEGPEHAVYIRGKSSSSVIELPDYWKGLVHEDTITVQLTPVGIYDKLYVEEIKDNKVTVYNNSEYFYFITGERKDIERFEVEYGDS